ncbi:hypothetical protein [Aeromonas veronii]|uniref:hypothetical protein n=2 Tax=Aeromonas veronii TaxID=654 RepID=UPI0035B82B6A
MKIFETMEESIIQVETLISNEPRMLQFNKDLVLGSLELFHDGLEIQSSFWFVIQNYLLQKSEEDQEAKELLKTMKRMGIE